MRDPNPQPDGDQFEAFRYHGVDGVSDRYHQFVGRDVPTATYDGRAGTLEEEVYNGGWNRNNRPTGPDPLNAVTAGMRGEPGWDNDATPNPNGIGFVEGSKSGNTPAGDISDSD